MRNENQGRTIAVQRSSYRLNGRYKVDVAYIPRRWERHQAKLDICRTARDIVTLQTKLSALTLCDDYIKLG